MAAAFAGGAAIHKGLGPAHAIALVCGDQDLHHGTLVAAALPSTLDLVARHCSDKADRIAAVLGLNGGGEIGEAVRRLLRELGLPTTYRQAGYVAGPVGELVAAMMASPFNRTSAYVPTAAEYEAMTRELVA